MSIIFIIFVADLNYTRVMNRYLTVIMLCAALLSAGNIAVGQVKNDTQETVEMPELDKMPQFPGGMSGMHKFLTENVRYPYFARQKKIQGRVMVQFVVDKDGTVTDVKVEKSVHKSLDKEAVRVVKKMPKWIPGEKDGKPVRVLYHMPVNFSLH